MHFIIKFVDRLNRDITWKVLDKKGMENFSFHRSCPYEILSQNTEKVNPCIYQSDRTGGPLIHWRVYHDMDVYCVSMRHWCNHSTHIFVVKVKALLLVSNSVRKRKSPLPRWCPAVTGLMLPINVWQKKEDYLAFLRASLSNKHNVLKVCCWYVHVCTVLL